MESLSKRTSLMFLTRPPPPGAPPRNRPFLRRDSPLRLPTSGEDAGPEHLPSSEIRRKPLNVESQT